MEITVAGTFTDRGEAEVAVERLRAAGIPVSAISMLVRESETVAPINLDTGVHGGAVVPETLSPVRPSSELPAAPAVMEADDALVPAHDSSATATGLAAGGLIGGLGGLLIGLVTLAVPGVGPLLAAGPLAAALGGAAFGAATGGLLGALIDAGFPEEEAAAYAADLERGHALLSVHTDETSAAPVHSILAEAGALNITPASSVKR
jgi:hypothetical protein